MASEHPTAPPAGRAPTASADALLRDAAVESHRVLFRRHAQQCGADVTRIGENELVLGSEAMIVPAGEFDVDVLMAEIRRRGCLSVGCWSATEDMRLGTRLLARGFRWGLATALDGPQPHGPRRSG